MFFSVIWRCIKILWTKIFLKYYRWLENSVQKPHKNVSDYLKKEVTIDSIEKIIVNTWNNLISLGSDCGDNSSDSDSLVWNNLVTMINFA